MSDPSRSPLIEDAEIPIIDSALEARIEPDGGPDVAMAELLAQPVDVGPGGEREARVRVPRLVQRTRFDPRCPECRVPDAPTPVIKVDVAPSRSRKTSASLSSGRGTR